MRAYDESGNFFRTNTPDSMNSFLLQNTQTAVEMADVMRSNGKIYVLLAVVLLIFAGIVFFLMFMEHRLSKLEEEVRDVEQRPN